MNWDGFVKKLQSYNIKQSISFLDYLYNDSSFKMIDDSTKIDFDMIVLINTFFSGLLNEDGYVITREVISALKQHFSKQDNSFYLEQIVRFKSKSNESSLGAEKMKDLLNRIESECDFYVDWNTFEQYFTRMGWPV